MPLDDAAWSCQTYDTPSPVFDEPVWGGEGERCAFSIVRNARCWKTGASPRRGGSLLNANIFHSHSKLLGEEAVVEGVMERLIPKTVREGIETLWVRVTDGAG